MKASKKLKKEDVVQLNPEVVGNKIFGECFMIVTEPKSWGAQGYVQIPGRGQAYYRAKWEEMEIVGRSVWMVE